MHAWHGMAWDSGGPWELVKPMYVAGTEYRPSAIVPKRVGGLYGRDACVRACMHEYVRCVLDIRRRSICDRCAHQ